MYYHLPIANSAFQCCMYVHVGRLHRLRYEVYKKNILFFRTQYITSLLIVLSPQSIVTLLIMKIHFTTSTVFYLTVISGTTVVQHVKAGGECKNSDLYQCGVAFPSDGSGDTCSAKGCCCDGQDGTGLQVATCRTNKEGYTNRGCGSCWGNNACRNTDNVNIGTNSCRGDHEGHHDAHQGQACAKTLDTTIENDACHGYTACFWSNNTMIKTGACIGKEACFGLKDSSIGEGSCRGSQACKSIDNSSWSRVYYYNLTIGNNSCNGDGICAYCEGSVVPSNACNDVNGDDVTDGKCNYCKTVRLCMFYPAKHNASVFFFCLIFMYIIYIYIYIYIYCLLIQLLNLFLSLSLFLVVPVNSPSVVLAAMEITTTVLLV